MSTTPDISTDPQLSREEALAILNTPDGELPELIARAEVLRRKYKGNHVSIHIPVSYTHRPTSPSPSAWTRKIL